MARLFLLGFLLLPIIEIALFIKVGQWIGLWPTLALVVGAAVLGVALLRRQGLSVLTQMRSNVSAGKVPGQAIADTMMIGLAAMLLIIPGFFTDAIGLALLLPAVRAMIYKALASRVSVVETSSYRRYGPANDPTIKGPDTIDLDEDDYRPH
ncbi:FxsA family protein [Devosia limi]|uniref:UPF0716 protein FxsA n=1 Tax=Devosia limi DSM 17137 TaxID=1121477 RepID=A0A1M4ZKZ5_9HYPH|nr:FxsA family protein [Devosia limi]SHF18246.1 UPF0716 protein FxsA [Devosia limi DSM 17137]